MNKLLLWATVICATCAASADMVELKTGEKVEGKFKQATSDGAIIDVGGQSLTFPLDKVRAIYLGNAPSLNSEPSSFTEALDALKGLRSVTATSGISYRDYSPRVLDAKVKVDKYLSSADTDDGTRRISVQLAMQYYELAATAWNANITKSLAGIQVGRELQENPALTDCPTIQTGIAEARRLLGKKPSAADEEISIGVIFGMRPDLLWSCASAKISALESNPGTPAAK